MVNRAENSPRTVFGSVGSSGNGSRQQALPTLALCLRTYLARWLVLAVALGLMTAVAQAGNPALEYTPGPIFFGSGGNWVYGWSFTTNQAITVTALDAFTLSAGSAAVRLYDGTGTTLASATVTSADPVLGSPVSLHSHAITPITLAAGTTYFVAQDIAAGQAIGLQASSVTTIPSITYGSEVSAATFGANPTNDSLFGGAYDAGAFGPDFEIAGASIIKSFSPTTIEVTQTSTLIFSIANSNLAAGLTGVGFTDNLPAGLAVATPNGLTGSCGGGTITAAAGASTISLAGATLSGAGTCTFSVNVVGVTFGTKNNSVTVTSSLGGVGGTATASLSVIGPPTVSKSFGAPTIPLGGSTSLSFIVGNPTGNPATLTGINFIDTLPSGLVVSTPNGLTGACGVGTITATAGGTSVSLSGAALAAGDSCTFSVNVTGNTTGAQNNSVTASSTNGGTGSPSTASVTVIGPPSITKSFGTASIQVGNTTSLSFTITNPNAPAVSLTGVSFTDTLPAGLVVATPNGLTGACGAGTITATAGSSSVSLSGTTLAGGANCTFSVNVTGTVDGVKSNSVTASSTNGGTSAPGTASITVFRVPTIQKTFGASQIFASQSTSLTFTLANPNVNLTLTGLLFSDTLPAGLVVSTPNGLSATCTGTVTAVAGTNLVSLGGSGAALSPGTSCTVSVNVTAVASGTWVNTTSTLTSDQATPGTAATATIVVFLTLDSPFQVSYALDPVNESYINLINDGANGDALLGPGFGAQAGNICANVYAFSPDEQLISCCSCLLTPNSVANLGVSRDLTIKTLTGVVPSSVVVKLVTTLPAGASCTNSAAGTGTLVNGLVAYATTPQTVGTTTSIVEHTFVPSTLSAGEYASITGRCAAMLGNGSGYGQCSSCRSGALGGQKQ